LIRIHTAARLDVWLDTPCPLPPEGNCRHATESTPALRPYHALAIDKKKQSHSARLVLDSGVASIYTGITLYERIHRLETTMKIYQLNNGRWQVTPKNPDDFNRMPHRVALAILWRSFETRQQAEDFAAQLA